MNTYSKFRPTGFDCAGLGLEDQQDWLVLPCGQNRDSDCLTESNFIVAVQMLKDHSEDFEVHRFGHWANGWFEIIIVRPETDACKIAQKIEEALDDYPILDENDYSEREYEEANLTWANCFSDSERIEYIQDNRDQFEFHSFSDMLGCVRGKFFAGYASELLNG